jgi:hypothetical protein
VQKGRTNLDAQLGPSAAVELTVAVLDSCDFESAAGAAIRAVTDAECAD